jgi:hypothetical protein
MELFSGKTKKNLQRGEIYLALTGDSVNLAGTV